MDKSPKVTFAKVFLRLGALPSGLQTVEFSWHIGTLGPGALRLSVLR